MKKICLFLIALCLCGALHAQQATELKRSKTVFAYPEFKVAKVNQSFGRFVKDTINIFLKDASLVFKHGDRVYKANVDYILGLEIDSVKYRKVGTQMARVIAQKGVNMLLCVTTVDLDILGEETHGPVSQGFFDLDIPSLGGTSASGLLDFSGHEREEDEGYPLKNKYYFLINGEPVVANESQIKKYVRPDMKTAWKNLMADRFWSWNDPQNLSQVLIYLPER